MNNEKHQNDEEMTTEVGIFEDSESDFEENPIDDEKENAAEASEEYKPLGRYDKILYRVYCDDTITSILKSLCYTAVALTVYAFLYYLSVTLPIAPMEALRSIVVCAVPFIAVTLARRIINAPRPYELYPFYKVPPKKKRGLGYPSRHVFSIFVIAAVLAFENIFLGIGIALLGVMLAVCRILLGIHFIRDTVAGAVIGISSGIIGIYITRFVF